MKKFALILEDDLQSLLPVKTFLRLCGFEVLVASQPEQAQPLLETFCPHLIFVDLDRYGRNLAWVESVRAGEFALIPLAVSSRTTPVDTLQRCIRMRVSDFILRPFHVGLLEKKIRDFCAKTTLRPAFEIRPVPGQNTGLSASFTVPCPITAISETGIQVGGGMMAMAPVERLHFSTDLFKEIGVSQPVLKLTNAGKRARPDGGSDLVNFVQVQGWSEDDRKLIRHWIRNNKLEAIE